jgi:hypothetical protein
MMIAFGKNSSDHLLSGCVSRSARLSLFAELSGEFPAFDYYDADIPLPLRFATRIGVSLLGRCRIDLIDNHVAKVEALGHPWLLFRRGRCGYGIGGQVHLFGFWAFRRWHANAGGGILVI